MNQPTQDFDPAFDSALYINGNLEVWGDKMVVRSFLYRQMEAWRWLFDLSDNFKKVHTALFGILAQERESTEAQQCRVSLGSTERPYIDAFSELGLQIKLISESHGELVAAFFVIYCIPSNRERIATNLGELLRTLASEHFYESALAMQLSINRKLESTEGNDTTESLMFTQRSATADLMKDLQSSRTNIAKTENELLADFDSKKNDFTESFQTAALFNKNRLRRYRLLTKKTMRLISKKISLAELDWEAKKARLKEQLEIKESITYWEGRESAHNLSKHFWLFALFVIMATTLTIMHQSAQSFLEDLHTKSAPASTPTKEPLQGSVAATPPPLINKTVEGLGSLNVSINAEFLAMFIIKLAGTILILTFSGILIKVSLRQYSNNVALSTNASERLAFIKTYLALMDEGKLDGREDRNLVLQALFRSSGVAANDIPVTTPIEILLKNT